MFEGPGFSLLVDAINSGQNTEELEHQLAERLEKDISNEEFLEKLPLPVIVRIVKSYNHEMTFDMAKQLLTMAARKYGTDAVILLPHIKIGKIGPDAAIHLLQCIQDVPIINELNAENSSSVGDKSNPTKVFVDFPASANVQLVFRPAPNP